MRCRSRRGAEASVSCAENWVGLGGLERDADYFGRVFMDTGIDLREIPMNPTSDILRRRLMTPDRDDQS